MSRSAPGDTMLNLGEKMSMPCSHGRGGADGGRHGMGAGRVGSMGHGGEADQARERAGCHTCNVQLLLGGEAPPTVCRGCLGGGSPTSTTRYRCGMVKLLYDSYCPTISSCPAISCSHSAQRELSRPASKGDPWTQANWKRLAARQLHHQVAHPSFPRHCGRRPPHTLTCTGNERQQPPPPPPPPAPHPHHTHTTTPPPPGTWM